VKNWHEEDLILYFYGEHPRREEIERALAADADLRERLEALRRDLERVEDPARDPGPDFENRVWGGIRPRLESRSHDGRSGWRWLAGWLPGDSFSWRPLAGVATLLLVAIVSYLVGQRNSLVPQPSIDALAVEASSSSAARDRVLFASVSRHLESSGLLLTDLAKAPASGEIGGEAEWARALLASNRLYRQAAERAGQRRIVALLDELEPVLLELSHRPAAGGVADLQDRIENRDLLFKVRSISGRLDSNRL
jgi:hypothetical protein